MASPVFSAYCMTDIVDCVVVGAGVVGLAVARQLARDGRDVLVIEAEDSIGTQTSSRNSEVIHAGIYYQPGSLKARFCRRGRDLLYAFCDDYHVGYRRCGKLIVVTAPEQLDTLRELLARGEANGVEDLSLVSPEEVQALEPEIRCLAALHSPSTGLIDSHALMIALQGDAEAHGAMIAFSSQVRTAVVTPEGFALQVAGGEEIEIVARSLVNCAGLGAVDLANKIVGPAKTHIPGQRLAKGNYFRLSARSPFDHLIYPVPEPGGLGVHVTLDLGGQARFGPDVQWVEDLDYDVDAGRAEAFHDQIRKYWPGLEAGSLVPDYAGIRPKIVVGGNLQIDFMICGEEQHGVSGLVNLFGIESPGLTSCLAIAEYVGALVAGRR